VLQTGVFVGVNEGDTAFGGSLSGPQLHYAGSFVDFGSIPSAIDIVSVDLCT